MRHVAALPSASLSQPSLWAAQASAAADAVAVAPLPLLPPLLMHLPLNLLRHLLPFVLAPLFQSQSPRLPLPGQTLPLLLPLLSVRSWHPLQQLPGSLQLVPMFAGVA